MCAIASLITFKSEVKICAFSTFHPLHFVDGKLTDSKVLELYEKRNTKDFAFEYPQFDFHLSECV